MKIPQEAEQIPPYLKVVRVFYAKYTCNFTYYIQVEKFLDNPSNVINTVEPLTFRGGLDTA